MRQRYRALQRASVCSIYEATGSVLLFRYDAELVDGPVDFLFLSCVGDAEELGFGGWELNGDFGCGDFVGFVSGSPVGAIERYFS